MLRRRSQSPRSPPAFATQQQPLLPITVSSLCPLHHFIRTSPVPVLWAYHRPAWWRWAQVRLFTLKLNGLNREGGEAKEWIVEFLWEFIEVGQMITYITLEMFIFLSLIILSFFLFFFKDGRQCPSSFSLLFTH